MTKLQDSNSNWPDRAELNANVNHNTTQLTPYNSTEISAATPNLSCNDSRSPGPLVLSNTQEYCEIEMNNNSDITNELGSLMHHARNAETHGHNITSWFKRPPYSGENSSIKSSDGVVINFDNINESPPSSSEQLNGPSIQRTIPEDYQANFLRVQLPISGNQRYAHILEQINRNVSANNSNNSNNNSNNNNSNNNSNTSNNDTNITINEDTQGENTTSRSSTERSSADKCFDDYISFTTFLTFKIIHDHREGILLFIGLLVTFTYANFVVKRQIAKQSRRSLLSFSIIFVNLSVCTAFVFFVFQEHQLYRSLIFMPPRNELTSIWDLLWLVGVTDFLVKFITIQIKIGLACLPAKLLPYTARGKWYLMIECSSQLYRGLVPIQPWIHYVMALYTDSDMANFLFLFYMVCKGMDLKPNFSSFIRAFWKLMKNASLGSRPSKEELDSSGSQCPICHDEYNAPVLLSCGHIFCEDCVTTWFDREQTCPLCRAKVRKYYKMC